MMKTISSKEFYRAWIQTVELRKEEMLGLWRSAKEYTKYIKGQENSVLKDIADKLELEVYEQDYYSVDAIFYKPEDKAPSIDSAAFCLRDLRIAFEHENDFNSGLQVEVSHLLITACDLRVLVTYPDFEPDEMLNGMHKVIKGNRLSERISENESFLIICGYENGFAWEGYVYQNDDFKKLEASL